MDILYSNILPLAVEEGKKSIVDCFRNQIAKSDKVDIAVGYISYASLEEIETLVDEYDISNICITISYRGQDK